MFHFVHEVYVPKVVVSVFCGTIYVNSTVLDIKIIAHLP